jgi:hypothetical protein
MEFRTRKIDRKEWKDFFDRISRHYKGRVVDVGLIERGKSIRHLGRGQPFIGVTAEGDVSRGNVIVEVIAGGIAEDLFCHVVSSPQHVWMNQEANGGDNALGIESEDGSTLLIEFEAETEPAPGTNVP